MNLWATLETFNSKEALSPIAGSILPINVQWNNYKAAYALGAGAGILFNLDLLPSIGSFRPVGIYLQNLQYFGISFYVYCPSSGFIVKCSGGGTGGVAGACIQTNLISSDRRFILYGIPDSGGAVLTNKETDFILTNYPLGPLQYPGINV